METDDVKGLIIFVSFMTFTAFILGGMMERRLANVDKIVKNIEDDTKYVN